MNMGTTKSEIFTSAQNELAAMFKAMAHPARIAILQSLLKRNECVCGSLVDELGLAQATVSQHLKELKNAGLIQGTVEGTRICYCINPEVWTRFGRQLTAFLDIRPVNNPCC
jgi:DNA-binding transcriptional ArsR family regulator